MTAISPPRRISPSPLSTPPNELLDFLRESRRPVVLGHVVPDADCLGSALALVAALRECGADAQFGLPDGAGSRKLDFMFQLAADCPRVSGVGADRDAVIAVDTASEKRVNLEPRPDFAALPRSGNIDHHITNTNFARVNWVDPHASSSAELIARVILALRLPIRPRVASLLYAGIHGDTAGFSLPTTTSDTLTTAAELVRAGADVAHIGERLCRSLAQSDFELLRRVYDHTTSADAGRIAYSFLSYDDMAAAKCTADDIDDQVSIPRALKGVRIAMLFTEGEPNVIRVNLRGEGNVSVIEIAQQFGGGGHTQSAGIRMRNRTMSEAIEQVVAASVAHLNAGTAG